MKTTQNGGRPHSHIFVYVLVIIWILYAQFSFIVVYTLASVLPAGIRLAE